MKSYITAAIIMMMGLCASMAQGQVLHKFPTQQEIDYFKAHPEEFVAPLLKTTSVNIMPADARFPGEYEEVQAVTIGWPYNGTTLDTTSSSAGLWAKMTDAIQQECAVWIRLQSPGDSSRLKTFLTNKGTPLSNYRFFFYPGNAYWMRDFGPLGFYYSGEDSIGFLDMNYYISRPLDNQYPAQIASELGYLNVRSSIFAEGGNYMTDGWKRSFHSSRIESANAYQNNWTVQQVSDSIHYYWASDSVMVTKSLSCDGGTGHIDMYMKLMDDQTFAIMEYPNIVTASDKATIDSVITMLSKKNSVYNKPYRMFRLPMPTKNDGTYNTTCGAIDNDARTFVNGLLVNKTYIMPAFSSATSGNVAGDSTAIEIFREILPGYNIVPVDSRNLTILGGAIHCVTMQIPAENPLRIWHPALTDLQPLTSNKHLIVKAYNHTGIAGSEINWRLKGTGSWNTITMTDSSGYHTGDITHGFTITDTVEYYISATSNNGKTTVKPLTAPTGFYTFYFNTALSTGDLNEFRNFVLNPVPNPSAGTFYIPLVLEQSQHISSTISDITGRTLSSINHGNKTPGIHKLGFDITGLSSGVYYIRLNAGVHILGTKRIVKQ